MAMNDNMNDNINDKELPQYIASLLRPDAYDHAVESIELIETHISWVILTGAYAYKIKKPVNLGFLDFSSLEKRHFYCQEELRLNSRLAPMLYLDVLAITGPEQQALFSARGKVIEYAVKMTQFPLNMQMDNLLAAGQVQTRYIDSLAKTIALFHQQTEVAGHDTSYGEPETIYSPVQENFIQLQQLLSEHKIPGELAQLEHWSRSSFKQLKPVLQQRKQ